MSRRASWSHSGRVSGRHGLPVLLPTGTSLNRGAPAFDSVAPLYSDGMPVILSCSLSLYRADVFFCHANQTSRQKATPRQTPSRQTRPEECFPEEACPRQSQGPPPFEGNAAGLPCSEEACPRQS